MPYLKIMSSEDLHDSDKRKNFTIVTIGPLDRCVFVPDMSYPADDPHVCALIGPHAGVDIEGFDIPESERDRVVALTGMTYVMSDMGKTVAMRRAD